MKPVPAAQPAVWASPSFNLAIASALLVHAGALALWVTGQATRPSPPDLKPPIAFRVTLLEPAKPLPAAPRPQQAAPPQSLAARQAPKPAPPQAAPVKTAGAQHLPASMEAPPPPSAEEWQQAATYTLKNSKRYRYAWGQQVRSMMGTAVEGPQQGDVRFRVEIAPDGRLAKLETLWSTSETAERLAREALSHMPPLPPTPTGQPLVFEKTISFQPQDRGWPPIYKYDCLPDPPGFKNPFAWNGSGEGVGSPGVQPPPAPPMSAAELEACANSLPKDSLEAVTVDQDRQFKHWGSLPLNGVK